MSKKDFIIYQVIKLNKIYKKIEYIIMVYFFLSFQPYKTPIKKIIKNLQRF